MTVKVRRDTYRGDLTAVRRTSFGEEDVTNKLTLFYASLQKTIIFPNSPVTESDYMNVRDKTQDLKEARTYFQ